MVVVKHLHPNQPSTLRVEGIDFSSMLKPELIAYANQHNIDISSATLKEDIRKIIEESVTNGD
ncbi:hypothetical protein RGU76_30475 [Bacillus pseudomycoides]|uniref:hypothetical protein n=1 Tax=Bacillus TaxID=1386 RepID=UPI00224880B7|nr:MULTISPECIES: hypothetical protein [Bacillus]MCX2825266.1 hypothetical protein [Bacillus sp. DHT2]MDR4919117.1 hypothetical protein [Bacillus pseudomycoides]